MRHFATLKLLTSSAMALALLVVSVSTASAGSASRVGGTAQPETTLFVGVPSEIDDVRVLLQRGSVDRAVRVARELVASLQNSTVLRRANSGTQTNRYLGNNTLCVALTAQGNTTEAIERCDRAIAIIPSHWEGYNSRPTPHFVARNYRAALADFEMAKEMGPSSQDYNDLLDHNIDLARRRLN